LPRYCNHTDPRGSNVPFQRGSNYSVTWRPRGYHVHLLAGVGLVGNLILRHRGDFASRPWLSALSVQVQHLKGGKTYAVLYCSHAEGRQTARFV